MATLYQPHNGDLRRVSTLHTQHTQSTEHSLSSDVHYVDAPDVKLVLNFTLKEIELVRTTWQEMVSDDLSRDTATVANHASIASSLFCIQFYANLLSMEPGLEKMFPSIKHQAVSFAGVLATAIINLESLHVLDDYLNNLGKRHARILGIDPPHFELMGVALLKTFQDRFGGNFSLELERCWARLYTYLANSILQFGIDPVLRVDKTTEADVLERTSSAATTDHSLFDQNSVSSTSSSFTITAAKPSPSQLARDAAVHSNLHHPKTSAPISARESKIAKRISRANARDRDDKDCVIM